MFIKKNLRGKYMDYRTKIQLIVIGVLVILIVGVLVISIAVKLLKNAISKVKTKE